MMNNSTEKEVFLFPLSVAQQRLWVLSQFEGVSAAYNMPGHLYIKGKFNVDVFKKTVDEVIARHESLRTTFDRIDNEIVQIVTSGLSLDLPVHDIAQLPAKEKEVIIKQAALNEARLEFDLKKGPLLRMQLYRTAIEEFHLLFTMHHIICDGWSIGIFIAEISKLYEAFLSGDTSPLPDLSVQYGDYAMWQKEWLTGAIVEKQLSYWRKKLHGAPALLSLPTDRTRPAVQSFNGNTFTFTIDSALTKKLHTLGIQYNSTLFMTLFSAFATLLWRYSREEDIVIGTPNANRNRAELEGLIGFFVSTLLLRSDLSGNPSFSELLQRTRSLTLEAYENQDISFEKILEEIKPERSLSYNPLFQVMFSMENLKLAELQWPGIETRVIRPENVTSKFDLTLAIEEHPHSLTGKFEYNTDLFDSDTIQQMAAHFVALVEAVASNPEEKIAKLRLLNSASEVEKIKQWNSTVASYPREQCIHHLFEENVTRSSDAEALIFNHERLTYSELNTKANQLARYLRTMGVGKGNLIGISMERSVDMVVGVLAILKSGAAYVPLDPAYPHDRIAFIIKDSGINFIVSHRDLAESFSEVRVIDIDAEKETIATQNTGNLDGASASSDLAYVIYTSGSTGQPKGVEIRHQSVVNFLWSMRRQPGISEKDSLLAVTSLSFDIAGLELFLPLVTGAKLIVADRQAVSDGEKLIRQIDEQHVTIMQATPATWKLMLDAGWNGNKKLKVLCGGEAFPRELANKLLAKAGSVWNMYGPTETTIWSTVWNVQPGNGSVLIGYPINNTSIYLLDECLQPVPAGIPAELYIGGDGVAKGYLNRTELTKERFLDDPFADTPGAKLYRTGDLAKYRKDGTIEFIGRIDHQIKLNGHRIELGEIENVLHQYPHVKESVVMIREDIIGSKRLVAYIIADGLPHPHVNELRNHLIKKLPAYMIPSAFVMLDEFPLTPNGKIDRKALPAPEGNRPDLLEEYVEPQTSEEKLLAEIWVEVLGIEKVGIHDNFFALGGASLQSVSVASKATEAGLLITPELIFEHQTIELLARAAQKVVGIHTAYHTTSNTFKLTKDSLYTPGKDDASTETETKNIIIESLGIYLPSREVTSKEIVSGCKTELKFPMERLTGIRSRRMVETGEYAVDLAIKAIEKCLALSQYHPEDIDLFICCNVFRYDGDKMISFEPGTSMKLKSHFALKNAMVFDVSNACAGVFTAISIAESYIKSGTIKNALIASGEYLTHLTHTSQLEVESYMDTRIAGLTVGDSGLAMIVESAPKKDIGFHEMELFTMGAYSSLCVVKATEKQHGGLILNTDAIRMAEAGHVPSSKHAFKILKKGKWTPDSVKYLIMHQASSTTLKNTMREINKLFGKQISHEGNTIDNIAERGNTATTTHFMAIVDNVHNNKIKPGDKVVFCISGSGLNLGTALYTFDDLPERLRSGQSKPKLLPSGIKHQVKQITPLKRVKISGIGTYEKNQSRDSVAMLKHAAESCIAKTTYSAEDIGLLIYAGVYRNDFILEPAIAALLAGEIGANATNDLKEDKLTFVFDLFNGAIGFLNACALAVQMMQSGKSTVAMITAAEIENNLETDPDHLLQVDEKASAMMLSLNGDSETSGFDRFFFKDYMRYYPAVTTYATWRGGKTFLKIDKAAGLEEQYIACIKDMIEDLTTQGLLDAREIKAIFPPQISSTFISALAAALELPAEKFIDTTNDKDLYTSSLPFAIEFALGKQLVKGGDKGLMISVGGGIQVGCAIYQF